MQNLSTLTQVLMLILVIHIRSFYDGLCLYLSLKPEDISGFLRPLRLYSSTRLNYDDLETHMHFPGTKVRPVHETASDFTTLPTTK